MEISNTKIEKTLHLIASNINYITSLKKAKTVLIASDYLIKGKSYFIKQFSPLLSNIFNKKILVVSDDMSFEKEMINFFKLEDKFNIESNKVNKTQFKDVNYLHINSDKIDRNIMHDLRRLYDVIFINTKNLKANKVSLPNIPIDGCFFIKDSEGKTSTPSLISNYILDQGIPILGVLFNDGGYK